MNLFIFKTCAYFLSSCVIKRLNAEALTLFRKVEKLSKKYVKLEADIKFLQFLMILEGCLEFR